VTDVSDQVVPSRTEVWRSRFHVVWAIIGVGIILYALTQLMGTFDSAVQMVLITALFTFIIRRPVAWMETRGISRGWGSIISIVVALGALVGLGSLIFPPLFHQIGALLTAIPHYIDQATAAANGLIDKYGYLINADSAGSLVASASSTVSDAATNLAKSFGQSALAFGTSFVSSIVIVLMSLVAAFWVSKDLPRIGHEVLVLGGPRHERELIMLRTIGTRVLGGYIRGLIITSTCTGLIAGIGFAIIGVPYAALLGLVTGILNIIPYIGPWTGGLIAAIVGMFVSPWVSLGSIIITVVAQQSTDTFVTPRVMGATVELHPALVIVALTAGGAVGGIVGMIAAVPLAAALKALLIYWFESHSGHTLVSEDGAFFKAKPGGTYEMPTPEYDATGGEVKAPDAQKRNVVSGEETGASGKGDTGEDEMPPDGPAV
jgi:predicted PurR-regulated permease PerM